MHFFFFFNVYTCHKKVKSQKNKNIDIFSSIYRYPNIINIYYVYIEISLYYFALDIHEQNLMILLN